MAGNALDLAVCCCDVRQRAGPRSVAAMFDSATTPANAVFFFFFLPDNLKREKEWRKRKVLTPAL
jgi:hypothetical protein